jgi:uncharacterized protein (DUF927 family)
MDTGGRKRSDKGAAYRNQDTNRKGTQMTIELKSVVLEQGAIVHNTSELFVDGKQYFDFSVETHIRKENDERVVYNLVKTSCMEEVDEKGHFYLLRNRVFVKEMCAGDMPRWSMYI